jgi:hypothetical protein
MHSSRNHPYFDCVVPNFWRNFYVGKKLLIKLEISLRGLRIHSICPRSFFSILIFDSSGETESGDDKETRVLSSNIEIFSKQRVKSQDLLQSS